MPTQSTDRITTELTDGIDFDGSGETWIINPGILVYSPMGFGVFSTFNASTLLNYGIIKSGGGTGVPFTGGGAVITNNPGASIVGAFEGIGVTGDGAAINNSGAVIGVSAYGVYFDFNSDHVVLTNRGYIYGGTDGILESSDVEGGVIHNSGEIRSNHYGIEVTTAASLTTTITNAGGGVIRGSTAAIYTFFDGGISLTNHGALFGGIDCTVSGQKDVVVNAGAITGPVLLGPGKDSFNGNGGTSGAVFGEKGSDILAGGARGDHLHGGLGNDTLTGRDGPDRFYFDTTPNAAINVDTLTDFTPTQGDKIVLSETNFAGLGPLGTLAAGHFHVGAAVTPNPQIIYTPRSGFLTYDANGDAPGGTTHFAMLTEHVTLTTADFLVVA